MEREREERGGERRRKEGKGFGQPLAMFRIRGCGFRLHSLARALVMPASFLRPRARDFAGSHKGAPAKNNALQLYSRCMCSEVAWTRFSAPPFSCTAVCTGLLPDLSGRSLY